jgi:hypothetical protein
MVSRQAAKAVCCVNWRVYAKSVLTNPHNLVDVAVPSNGVARYKIMGIIYLEHNAGAISWLCVDIVRECHGGDLANAIILDGFVGFW